jgi:hypothetical protein
MGAEVLAWICGLIMGAVITVKILQMYPSLLEAVAKGAKKGGAGGSQF